LDGEADADAGFSTRSKDDDTVASAPLGEGVGMRYELDWMNTPSQVILIVVTMFPHCVYFRCQSAF